MPHRAPRGATSRLALLAASVALVAGGCVGPLASPTPVPAGTDTKTETRSIASFSSVSVDGQLNVVVASGATAVVEVQAPSNVLPLIETTLSGTDLTVAVAAPGFTSMKPVTVRIMSTTLSSVSLSGGATGTIEEMGGALSVSASGGSVVKGIGTVGQLAVMVLGNSDAQLGDLVAETASISAAGGAKATLDVTRQLTGTADGGSVITLVVAPVAQSVTVTGGSKVAGP